MQVIKIDPGCAPQLADIPNTLEALQQAVGGNIEMITVRLDIRGLRPLVLIVNEEGRLMGLPANGSLMVPTAARHLLVGPVLIAQQDRSGEDLCGVTEAHLQLVTYCWRPARGGVHR